MKPIIHFIFSSLICFFISLNANAQVPANDEPCNAIDLTPTAACNYQIFTNQNATATAGVTAPGCALYSGGDVWFKAVVPCTGSIKVDTDPGVVTDGGMAFYTGSCSNLTLLDCNDDGGTGFMPQLIATGLTPGQTIWIRFWEFGNNTFGNFGICATIPPPPGPGGNCNSAQPFCTSNVYTFNNNTNVPSLGGGGIYDCLLTTPNPVFYYMQVQTAGTINIHIVQTSTTGAALDVDYACWGPFNSLAASCNGLSAANNISCSYSISNDETATITNAQSGEYYLLLLTNYSNQPGTITFQQSGGTAATNCSVICNISASNSGPVCPGQTFNLTSDLAGATYIWTGPNCYSSTAQSPTGVIAPSLPGTYEYTVLATTPSGNNCFATTILTVGALPGGSATHTNATCPGASDGSVTVTPSSPGTYTYTLNPGGYSQNNISLFSNIPAGTYTATFINSIGCFGTINNIVVGNNASPTATAVATKASCAAVLDGSITITPPATGGPFTYTLMPGNVVQVNNPVYTGLAAATYTITFTTSLGCTGTINNIIVGSNPAPTATAVATKASCPGVSDGIITITPPAIGAPFTYTLMPGNVVQVNNPVYTGLAAATYTINFATTQGCTGTISNIVVGNNPAPVATATPTNASCSVVSNGIITITPPATGTPFIYTLTPGNVIQNNNPVFAGLAGGITYSINFTTGIGCTGTISNIVVGNNASLTATATPTKASCPGVSDGIITITPPITGAPFTYTLMPGNVVQVNNPVYTGLAAATYTINFISSQGCTGTISNIVVGNNPAPVATATPTNAICSMVSNGIITITPPATGTPFIYTLTPGNVIQNNNPVFAGLAGGITYSINFTTGIGCTGTISNIILGNNAAPTATATPTKTSCPGVTDGVITITPPLSGGPFTYTLMPGNIVQNNNPVYTNLAAGTYSINFTTSIGCTGTISNIVVGNNPAPTATATPSNTSCPGVADGVITITPPLSGGPFTYTLNPGAILHNNNPIYTGLAAGITYTINFVTSIGCTGTIPNLVVNAGPPITTTATATPTSCPTVNDGTITITPPASGAPFVYTLMPGNVVQNNNPIFSNLSPNTYSITFSTSIGCSGIVPNNPVVLMGSVLSSTTNITNPPCSNIIDGILEIIPPAIGNYTYTLNPGTPSQLVQINNSIFTGLASGNYTYSLLNTIGCAGTGSATLTTHTPITVTNTLTMPLCNGNANGTISLTTSGGVSPYQYSKNGGLTWQNTGVFNGLTQGIYTFRIKDNVGCTKDITLTLNEPTLLTASASSTPGTCNGNDGTILISTNTGGGTAPYTYSIDNGATYQSSPSFIVSGGNYPNIKVKDFNGCIASTSVSVTLIDNMTLTPADDVTICLGQSTILQPIVSTNASIFKWKSLPDTTLITTLDNPLIKNPVATPTDTISYALIAQWGVCQRLDTIEVNILHKPIAHAGDDMAVCNYKKDTILVGSASNLSGTVNFQWTPAASLQTPNQSTTIANPDITQLYTLTVTDNYGCNFSVTDQVTITVQPPVPAFAGKDTIAVRNVPHQLRARGGVSYLWSPSFPLDFTTIQNPLATLNDDQLFIVEVTDAAGCLGKDSVFIKVYNGPSYYVPNTFTPNKDGLNDIFRAVPVGISYTEWFKIYDRYGKLVFQTNKWMQGWDGTYLGKMQTSGAYVWMIKGLDRDGKVVEQQGTVILIN